MKVESIQNFFDLNFEYANKILIGKRYKFLAFDYTERVDETRDNCRLLLIRLKLEGWALGQHKVMLKYYNEEFLSRYVICLRSFIANGFIDFFGTKIQVLLQISCLSRFYKLTDFTSNMFTKL